MRKFLSTCVLLALHASIAVAQESKSGHYQVSDVPPAIVASFLSSIYEGSLWTVPDAHAGGPHQFSPEEKLLWAGAENRASVLLGDPKVTFTREAIEAVPPTPGLPANSFDLQFKSTPTQLVVTSSAPRTIGFVGGVAIPYSKEDDFQKFIPGADDTGFVALAPRTISSDWYAVGICPRNKVDDKKKHGFAETFYKPTVAQFTVKGNLMAKQRTGNRKGIIEAEILTSENIPRAAPSSHRVEFEDPEMDFQYFEDSEDSKALNTKLPYSGIKVLGALTGPSKATWKKSLEGFIRVVPFTIAKPITIQQDGTSYTLESGECFAFFRGVLFNEELSGHLPE